MADESKTWLISVVGFGVMGLAVWCLYCLARRSMWLAQQGSPNLLYPAWAPPPEALMSVPSIDVPVQAALPAPAEQLATTPRYVASTYTVALDPTGIAMVAGGFTDAPAIAIVTAVSPGGASAILSLDPAVVSQADPQFPTGNLAVVNVGQRSYRVRLQPGQSLYGKGTADNTLVSASVSPED